MTTIPFYNPSDMTVTIGGTHIDVPGLSMTYEQQLAKLSGTFTTFVTSMRDLKTRVETHQRQVRVLVKRALYNNRKGRRAVRRLRAMGIEVTR